jgi:hypothetical protein
MASCRGYVDPATAMATRRSRCQGASSDASPPRGKIERLGAVHEEPPSLVAVARGMPPVAHVNPFPRVGLMLREQRQQARRGEPQTNPLARPLLRNDHRPYEALGVSLTV